MSPPGVRYYNPSSDNRQAGSSFVGVHWRTSVERVCCQDEYGMLSFTFRKLVDPADLPNLPRKYIAVFMNQARTQRVVVVNELGIYTGNTPWILEEIEYWLANLVPVEDVDGPEWRGARARSLTPPAERRPRRNSANQNVRGRSSLSSSPSVKDEKEEEAEGVLERFPLSSASRSSSPSVKKEESEEELEHVHEVTREATDDGADEEDDSSSSYSFDMGEDEQDMREDKQDVKDDNFNKGVYAGKIEELVELGDIPAASGSGRACMRNLIAARKPQVTAVVQGARISKNAKGKQNASREGFKDLRNGSIGFQVSKVSSQRSK